MELLNRIAAKAELTPDAPALSDGTQTLSYQMLWQRITTLAAALSAAKVQRLALELDNGIDWAIFDLASLHADIVVIPVPIFFSPAQKAWLLESSGADALTGRGDESWQPTTVAGYPLLRREVVAAPALPEGTVKITYTSGTTGNPKGVCLGIEQIETVVASLWSAVADAKVEQHLTILPLATLLENITGLYLPLYAGVATTIPPLAEVGFTGSSSINPEILAKALLRHQPHSLVLVPELLRLLLRLVSQMPTLAHSLRFIAVGGGKVAPLLLEQGRQLGLPLYEGYGLSECCSVVALNRPNAAKFGSVGKPLNHVTLRFSPEGEILVRGSKMLGYLSATAPDDEIATGDLGYLDAEGYLHISGRKKSVQITAFGRNFSPEWIEAELQTCSAIARCVVIGEALPANVAVISPFPGAETVIASQLEQVNQRLPDYAQIKHWLLAPLTLESGLITANGRPRREAIQQAFCGQIQNFFQGE